MQYVMECLKLLLNLAIGGQQILQKISFNALMSLLVWVDHKMILQETVLLDILDQYVEVVNLAIKRLENSNVESALIQLLMLYSLQDFY